MTHLRLGVIGCGGYATGVYAPALASLTDVELAAVCDPDETVTGRFVDAWRGSGVPQAYTDVMQMLDAERLDGVLIATPHSTHAELTRSALSAGCHVLVEKPMSVTPAEAEAVREAGRRAGRHVLIGYKTPYTGALQATRRALEKERCGPLRGVTGYIAQNWQAPTTGSWRQDPDMSGGGQFMDSGSHLVCSLLWALRRDWSEVYSCMANRGTAVDIDSVVIARFEGDILVGLTIGGRWQPEGTILRFCCDNGRIEVDGWRGAWARICRAGEEPEAIADGTDTSPVEHLCAVIRGEASPLVDAQHGYRQARFVADVYRSSRGTHDRDSE
jgi:predicted dehydrogenase